MKRFLRFSLRGFLIAVTLVAVFGGREILRQKKQATAVEAIRNTPGCFLGFDYDVASPEWDHHLPVFRSTISGWLRDWTESDLFCPAVRLWLNFDASDPAIVQQVSALPHLKWLHLAPAGAVPHEGLECPPLEPLLGCKRLEYVVLGSWVHMRPNGTPPFNGTGTTLLPLNLDRVHIQTLSKLRNLRVLAIGGSRVSNASLDDLSRLVQLEYLYLSNANLSDQAVAGLRTALPNTKIILMDDRTVDYSDEIDSRF